LNQKSIRTWIASSRNRNLKDLYALENEIKNSLEDPDFSEQIDYWHTCITKIKISKAKSTIESLYQEFVRDNEAAITTIVSKADLNLMKMPKVEPKAEEIKTELVKKLNKEMEVLEKEIQEHQLKSPFVSTSVLNTRFDLNDSVTFENMDSESVEYFKNEEENEYEEKEDEFTGDVIFFKGVKYDWSEKYKPRKPRFFNRVKSGFEWNPYNRKHYDEDNPPPKIVQGYKFNIFYPDLINKMETPQYYLEN